MNKRWIRACAALLALAIGCVAATSAAAGEARTHDGFFLRLAPGLGTGNAKIEDAGDKLDLSGGNSDGEIAIGGRVGKNLMLHGTMFGWIMSGPKADLTLSGLGSASTDLDGNLMLSGFGGGLTYYMMPTNLYVTGSLGMATLTSDLEDPFKGDSESGFAFTLGLGKEWWVGDAWGLGLAGAFTHFSAQDKDIVGSSENWSGPSYALRFSATFN